MQEEDAESQADALDASDTDAPWRFDYGYWPSSGLPQAIFHSDSVFLSLAPSLWPRIAAKVLRRAAHAALKTTGSMLILSRSSSLLLTLAASLDSDMSSVSSASPARG